MDRYSKEYNEGLQVTNRRRIDANQGQIAQFRAFFMRDRETLRGNRRRKSIMLRGVHNVREARIREVGIDFKVGGNMAKFLSALTALVVLSVIGASAVAQSRPFPGVVNMVDSNRHMVVFEDGTQFYAGPGVEVDGLKPGTKVIFYYVVRDGRKIVTSYEFAQR